MSGAAVFATVLVISPIVIRNYLTFPDFTPTGGTIGVNLWEGLGETELGRQHGFLFGDDKLIEYERVKLGWPADTHFDSQWPDGIRRMASSSIPMTTRRFAGCCSIRSGPEVLAATSQDISIIAPTRRFRRASSRPHPQPR